MKTKHFKNIGEKRILKFKKKKTKKNARKEKEVKIQQDTIKNKLYKKNNKEKNTF